MTLEVANGRLRVTQGGKVRFDSSDRMFHITNRPQGTIKIDNLATATPGRDYRATTAWDLGAVHPSANQIIGAVKFTLANYSAGMAFNRWHSLCGGSICWVMDGEPRVRDRAGANLGFRQGVFYNFDIVSGRARLVREVFLAELPVTTSYTVLAHSLTYKLKCGVWV